MSFTDILVHMRDYKGLPLAVANGVHLAKTFQAHLTGVYVVPLDPPAAFTLPEAAALQLLSSDREFEKAEQHRTWWEGILHDHRIHGDWHVAQGDCVEALCHCARFADLLVAELSVSEPDAPLGWGVIERAVFGTGIPTLVIPDKPLLPTFAQTAIIAWNGSREAARAVHAALPLLKRAKRVMVLRGAEKPRLVRTRRLPALRLEAHLQRHGIDARVEPLETSDVDAGEAILKAARNEDADLIVMGAWGRSRVSELVLGGATRYLFRESSVPLFVAH